MDTSFETTSVLAAPPDEVWRRIGTPAGINHELAPILRMTVPRSLRDVTLDTVPLGVRVCRSWLLLFGVVPVGFDDLTLAEREHRRFREVSRMTGFRHWEHERAIRPQRDGCELTDRITFEPAGIARVVPGASVLYGAVLRRLFRHRHRRLRAFFGTP